MRTIDAIVVHCTDSPDARDVGVVEINDWHVARGWKGIGYHYVVRRSGAVEIGRPVSLIGAHAEGYNAHSIGVVWVGQTTPAPDQMRELLGLLRKLMAKHKISFARVFGHHELNPHKTCPNLDMVKLREALHERAD